MARRHRDAHESCWNGSMMVLNSSVISARHLWADDLTQAGKPKRLLGPQYGRIP